jgi:hypothetical protein
MKSILIPIVVACGLASCAKDDPAAVREGSARAVLKPLVGGHGLEWRHHTAYVPVYSSIYWGFDGKLVDLSITLTIRNVSTERDLIVHSVRYYDSAGKQVRTYVDKPSSLAPMATADFVVQRRDTAGGIGASFLVETASEGTTDDGLIEALMIGQSGNTGLSFPSGAREVGPKIPSVK